MKKRLIFISLFVSLPIMSLFAAASKASDGHLFFLLILGILGVILGVFYLADYLKFLLHKFNSRNNHEIIDP